MIPNLNFIHRFIPGVEGYSAVLLLLHGTGGNEEDLIPLGQMLLPGAAILSPRGKVLESGMPRFFRRLAEGVFDLEDLKLRTDELARFINAAQAYYELADRKFVAVGYSNGANIAASLLLRHPGSISEAVLFRAMVPFRPETLPDLSRTAAFLSAGQKDPIVAASNTQELARILEDSGAKVFIYWHPGGHELGSDDLEAAGNWISQRNTSASPRTQAGI